MVYPNSPFKITFNNKLITNLFIDDSVTTTSVSNEELLKIQQWLCSSPKITSLRVNTIKTNIAKVLKVLKTYFAENCNYTPNVYIHPSFTNVIIIDSGNCPAEFKKFDKEIIVDTDCASAILRGAHIYAPGVLGMVSGCQINENVSIYADVAKKCKKGLQRIYENDFKIFIGNGIVKMQRHQLFATENIAPSGIAVEVTETISGCVPINESILPVGEILLQNIPSILCVHNLNPKPGDVVLDMCASPGNKTTHIAELMQHKGILIAIDKTPKKVAQLQKRCEDFGARVYSFQADSTAILSDTLSCTNIIDGPPFAPQSFDKILLDAPCSVLGKRPQLANRLSENEIKSFVPLQRKLFESAAKLLKPGGIMVYSTCTITLSENEGMVAWALKSFNFLELIQPDLSLGEPGWLGTSLSDETRCLVQRFGPNSEVDSVGFFFAVFKKKT
ncbi:tRNA (cytosine(72)-C(5))-methyltransferase NSUN6 [Diabrotica undecimpunctata]|uniref:tRNA (cytosine(72)-C(5))-methyltransferase NSUN6 n=1 Tax=Diabrotica undecimpunctata TaxID=50387 RepID=UPI003B63EFAF